MTGIVSAAGAVCWRIIDGRPLVLVIHRPHRRDVSLPKGKVDAGESLPETAVREIREETGLAVALGVPLGCTEYVLPSGRPKVVYYWAAQVTEKAVLASDFLPNDEVEALEWVTLTRARSYLTYPHDVTIVDEFARIAARGALETFAIVVLRHAKAVPVSSWDGRDSTRRLTGRGRIEAAAAARALAAWRPRRLVSSTAKRCRSTIAPLSALVKKPVRLRDDLSQESHEHGTANLRALVGKRVRARRTAVLCSHRPVIPEILREIALATATPLGSYLDEAAALPTGGFAVVHLSIGHPGSGIIAIETHRPLG
ncbi:NUDIX hydrolase [Rathayibacter rathayi]|uniref:NUDIX hydrolase n=1 Tax=Rathayibacter rathayi TaxID=33887 RepID=UPI000CE7523E|nr:NUDIX hydrolase [Rathayibacter rathayi]PPF23538.1 DNA mismatch repair protein MutT [Rathayibacter rathayi]PPG88499.1 DNA mismatch repair protein MutT [Rathayibacter rathayi]PPG94802.1 DNA mismatch repair protein MutT [Rathayibacter rathayi]PPG98820.1 DNA mismatch repair protein MutT [Rathayibacter rathayi]